MEKKLYLILQSGKIFEGKSFGAECEVSGEIVFTTTMGGLMETVTDSGYYGQLVVQTFPLIGNYGVIRADMETSKPQLKAYIVREWCREPSNFRCEGNIDTFLKEYGVVGLYDIDTRELTKTIRREGSMNGMITDSLDNLESKIAGLSHVENIVDFSKVSISEPEVFTVDKAKCRVGIWDFGYKASIRKALLERGAEVVVLPYHITSEKIAQLKLDGLILSNGAGDPMLSPEIITEIKAALKLNLVVMGIDLGHLFLALAQNAKVSSMKFGHHGGHPVKDLDSGNIYITSQGHEYCVDMDSLPLDAKVSFININDKTCEGISYNDRVFSVQFHPEGGGGPLDTLFLFDRLLKKIEEGKSLCR